MASKIRRRGEAATYPLSFKAQTDNNTISRRVVAAAVVAKIRTKVWIIWKYRNSVGGEVF